MSQNGRFVAQDFSALIAAPVTALLHAQAQAMQSTVDLLRDHFMTGDRLHTTTFQVAAPHERPLGADPPGEALRLTVPTASLVNLPHVRIAEATVEFSAKVVGLPSAPATAEALPPARLPVVLAHGRRSPHGGKSGGRACISVKLRVVGEEAPVSLQRLVEQANQPKKTEIMPG